MTIKLAQHNLV